MGSIFRWDKYADQFIHHITVVFFMLHREQIHLVLNRTWKLCRIDLQGIIHKHLIVLSVCTLILRDHKLVLIFSEIQPTDDPVQLISSLVGLADRTADLENKVILEVLDRCLCLFIRCLPVGFQIITRQAFQKLLINLIIFFYHWKITLRIFFGISTAGCHQLLIDLFFFLSKLLQLPCTCLF